METERIITLGIQAKRFAGGAELEFHGLDGSQGKSSFIPETCADLSRVKETVKGKWLNPSQGPLGPGSLHQGAAHGCSELWHSGFSQFLPSHTLGQESRRKGRRGNREGLACLCHHWKY